MLSMVHLQRHTSENVVKINQEKVVPNSNRCEQNTTLLYMKNDLTKFRLEQWSQLSTTQMSE